MITLDPILSCKVYGEPNEVVASREKSSRGNLATVAAGVLGAPIHLRFGPGTPGRGLAEGGVEDVAIEVDGVVAEVRRQVAVDDPHQVHRLHGLLAGEVEVGQVQVGDGVAPLDFEMHSTVLQLVDDAPLGRRALRQVGQGFEGVVHGIGRRRLRASPLGGPYEATSGSAAGKMRRFDGGLVFLDLFGGGGTLTLPEAHGAA